MHYSNTMASHHSTHAVRRVIMLALLLVALVLAIAIIGASRAVSNQAAPTQRYTDKASSGATHSTGAPTTNTNTPGDRTVPSSSGGDSNSLLRP